MGNYLVDTDVQVRIPTARLAQLTAESGSDYDPDIVSEAIDAAEGEANGYIAVRYVVPVDLVQFPDLLATLKGAVLDVVVYRLHLRRPPVPEDVTRARDNAIAWFKLISEGKVLLPSPTIPTSVNSGAAWGSQAANRPEQ